MTTAHHPAGPTPRSLAHDLNDADLQHLRWMILSRALDDRMLALYRAGDIVGNVFTGHGQEALSAAIGMHLRRHDVFAPLIRDQAGRLAFGETLLDVARTLLMKATGPMRGRDGNVHRGEISKGMLPMISHLGAMVAPVLGTLLSRRLQGRDRPAGSSDLSVGVASIGDGGMATGALHEAVNVAGIERLPFILVVANNQLSYSTFNDRSFACADLVTRAAGYGLAGSTCDGTDAADCRRAVGSAIARARRGEGPQMVVATLLRLSGHGSHDDASYVPAELKQRYGDCLPLAEERLIAAGRIDRAGVDRLWEEARQAIAAAVDQARQEADPDPAAETWQARRIPDLRQLRCDDPASLPPAMPPYEDAQP
jgi:TPP-dependent pyruvate/acetoin dehydrogenase alpha subunit